MGEEQRDKGTKAQRGAGSSFLFALLLAVSLCVNAEWASCSETVTLDSENQFAFAKTYFESAEYDKAIIEFERLIHFFPDNEKVDSALHLMGRAHYQLGRYAEAIDAFGRHIRRNTDETGIAVTPPIAESIWLASRSYQELGQTDRSLAILHRLLAETDDPAIEDETFFRIGWIHIDRHEWEAARKAFSALTAEGREQYGVPSILTDLEGAEQIPQKQPGLAGALSVIPGAGYLYLGRYRDAATAFLLNAALIGATWEAFDNGNEILGGLLGVVEAGFYSGNIYGSVSSAHKYNLDQVRRFIGGLGEGAPAGGLLGAFLEKDRIGLVVHVRY